MAKLESSRPSKVSLGKALEGVSLLSRPLSSCFLLVLQVQNEHDAPVASVGFLAFREPEQALLISSVQKHESKSTSLANLITQENL